MEQVSLNEARLLENIRCKVTVIRNFTKETLSNDDEDIDKIQRMEAVEPRPI